MWSTCQCDLSVVQLPNDCKSATVSMLGIANNEAIVLSEKIVREVRNSLLDASQEVQREIGGEEILNPLHSSTAHGNAPTSPIMYDSDLVRRDYFVALKKSRDIDSN